jgi:protein gp37
LIEATPHLDWLLLTKRIELFRKLAPWTRDAVPSNVWIGATCENRVCFDPRCRHLCEIEAIRFVSYEPALGHLKIGSAELDWIICGGESGAGARAMDPKWARSIQAECASRGVAFFMTQVGSNHQGWQGKITSRGSEPDEWPKELRVRECPSGGRVAVVVNERKSQL